MRSTRLFTDEFSRKPLRPVERWVESQQVETQDRRMLFHNTNGVIDRLQAIFRSAVHVYVIVQVKNVRARCQLRTSDKAEITMQRMLGGPVLGSSELIEEFGRLQHLERSEI